VEAAGVEEDRTCSPASSVVALRFVWLGITVAEQFMLIFGKFSSSMRD
jgi:hypothetical protein